MSAGLKILKWLLLYPLSLIYGIAVSVRNSLYENKVLKSRTFNFPVICVGNLTVGGTGKTPHVEYLLRLLKDDFNIGVLSRGYKRKTKGFVMADERATAKSIGDEPMQIKQKFPDVTVAVDEKRSRGIDILSNKKDIKAVILDDAFQHRKIQAGLNVLLTDYNRPFTRDHFLPYGRLREQAHEHRRAHIIIVTKCPKSMKPIEKRLMDKELKIYPFQYLYFTTFEYDDLVGVFDHDKKIKLDEIDKSKTSILGVSGIANNKMFRKKISALTTDKKMMHFMDHHFYNASDMNRIKNQFEKLKNEHKIVVTTEKDATKIKQLTDVPEIVKKHLYYLPVRVEFLGNEEQEEEFKYQIIRYVKTNRRYSKLYKGQDHLKS